LLPLPAPVAQIVHVLFVVRPIVIIVSSVCILPGEHLPRIRL